MNIRRATEQDIDRILALLSQVLEVHAAIRPDLFVSGTTKYSREELSTILKNDNTPIYVALDEAEIVRGYAFCVRREEKPGGCLVPMKSIYIDDLCVDETMRGQHIGEALFSYVRDEARREGCYELALNVWEGNDSARRFYDRMGFTVQKTGMEYIL